MSNIGKEIKSKINCVDLAYELNLDITKRGDHYRCKSFIHAGENDMSVIITPDSWYSFSDTVGGDVITMLAYAKYKGDESKAFRELATRFGLSNADNVTEDYLQEMDAIARYVMNCHNALRPIDREYLYKRRITDKTIDEFKIGYDSNTDRLIIPIYQNNKPVYWCGRDRSGVAGVSKYTKANLTEHPHRKNIMYGYDTLNNGSDTLIIAEGVFDYLSLHQEGYACLSNATAISNENIKNVTMLAHKFKRVILCFDNDVSGSAFTQRLYPALFRANINFEVCKIPYIYGKDISDYYVGGNSLNELFTKNVVNGTLEYLKLKYDDFDTLYEYVSENAPYINRNNKKTILEYVKTLTNDKDDLKTFNKQINREKTQDEYAREFIDTYENKLWFTENNGFYQYVKTHWERVSERELMRKFEEKYSVTATTEKGIFTKIQNKTFTTKQPNEKRCLNLRNGTLYFDNLYRTPYHFVEKHEPDDFCDYVLDYDYNPKAVSYEWQEFIDSITCGDPKLNQRFAEYFGSVFFQKTINEKGYMFYGNGSNGKDVLKEGLENLLGGRKLCSYTSLKVLGYRFGLNGIVGKWVNFCSEATHDTGDADSTLKELLSNSTQEIDKKNKDAFIYTPSCKIWVTCNELPQSKDKSKGWYRRFSGCIHHLKKTFTMDESKVDNETVFLADPVLKSTLKEPENLSGILNWAIEGYVRVLRNGYNFSEIDLDTEIEKEFYGGSNHLVDFVESIDWTKYRDRHASSNQLYEDYRVWVVEAGIHIKDQMTKKQFQRALENAFEISGTGKKVFIHGKPLYRRVV